MTPQNGPPKDTLYEQVLDFARREIEDASSQMDALRQSLRLVEARVEAAKSVYEAVAARLNLEDELEEEAQLDTPPGPPVVQEESVVPLAVPLPAAPLEPPAPIVEQMVESHPIAEPAPDPPLASPAVEQNAESPMFEEALLPADAPPPAPAAPEQPAESIAEAFAEPPAPSAPVPPPQAPAEVGSNGSEDGFRLSEADRALIGEYLRSKRDG